MQQRATPSRPSGHAFATIKVPEIVRRWLKIEAARQGVPMYVVLMKTLTVGDRKKPWEQVEISPPLA